MPKRIAMAVAALGPAATGTLALAAPAGQMEAHLVPMTEIVVPIVDGARVDGAFSVKLVLGAADESAAERITSSLPRLRSASLATTLEFSRLYASPLRPVDAERLSRDLTEALQREQPEIAQVLIVEVAARAA